MSDSLIHAVVTIATAIVGIAIIAVLVSNKAQTGTVITSAGSAFASDIAAAVSPVTGGTFNLGGGADLPNLY
jgi:PRD1 phage membrane DNA delivery